MTDKGSNSLTTTSEPLTNGSGGWYVRRYDTRENIASARSEAAVTDPEMRLSAVCEESAEESPGPKPHRSGINGVDPATSDREIYGRRSDEKFSR